MTPQFSLVLVLSSMKITLWYIIMSDDEDAAPVVKKQRIHFGSLEAVERERLAAAGPASKEIKEENENDDEQEEEENGVSAAVLAGIRAGNINISSGKLKNTGCWSTGYVSMAALSESSILPKFLEKNYPEVARPAAFSTWSVQNSRTIRHLRYAPQSKSTSQCKNLCKAGLGFWTDNSPDMLIGGFGSTHIPQVPLVENLLRCSSALLP